MCPKLLSGRERYIIENRYGLYACKPMTQREIAAALGISRSYVSRIEKRALEKLRKGMESAGGREVNCRFPFSTNDVILNMSF